MACRLVVAAEWPLFTQPIPSTMPNVTVLLAMVMTRLVMRRRNAFLL